MQTWFNGLCQNEISEFVQNKFHKQIHIHNKTLELMVFEIRNINILVPYRNKNNTVNCLQEVLSYAFHNHACTKSLKLVVVGDLT